MTRIVFVCAGNICRSPIAERLLRRLLAKRGVRGVEVASAGLVANPGEGPVAQTVKAARIAGVELTGHSARRLHPDLLRPGDRVLVMEELQRIQVLQMPGLAPVSVELLGALAPGAPDIADPGGQDDSAFEDAVARIRDCVEALAVRIESEARRSP